MSYNNVNDLSEYVEFVCKLNKALIRDGMDRYEVMLFRGHSNSEYELIPSLGRGLSHGASIFDEERNLIELAKFKLPDIFRNDLQPIELLALLQHHGVPTRLLDVTESALVALYFACCSNFDMDGEVLIFKNNDRDVTNYPVINAIADSFRFSRGSFYPLSLFYGGVSYQPYFLEQKQINEICHKTKEEGGRWIKECCEEIAFVYAPIRSLRQQLQKGRYIIFPNSIIQYGELKEYSFTTKIDPIRKDHKAIIGRVRIPKEVKKQMLLDMALMGISEEMLFADNIDTVCKSIVTECKNRVNQNYSWNT